MTLKEYQNYLLGYIEALKTNRNMCKDDTIRHIELELKKEIIETWINQPIPNAPHSTNAPIDWINTSFGDPNKKLSAYQFDSTGEFV
jgi:hypothetical protein